MLFYEKSLKISILQEHTFVRDYFYPQCLIFLECNSQQYGKIHLFADIEKNYFNQNN